MLLSRIANKEIINFLQTVTIKNKYFAQQMLELKVKDNVQDFLPEEYNPYYRHLNGEYILDERTAELTHSVVNPTTGLAETQTIAAHVKISDDVIMWNSEVYKPDHFDELMYITSLDTQTTIPFTKENLHAEYALAAGRPESSVHKKTLANYRLPSRYYTLLCEKYPSQVDLIKAIVYPIPSKSAAISADNYTALSYDDTLLNDNERVSLVSRMKGLLDVIRYRWDVKEYAFEEHYPMVVWGMIWNLLITHLRAQRFINIRTPNAHPLHIWEYLNSHGLGEYRGYLSSTQEMFLYRNLRYILANRGKQSTLNILIDELLNESGIDLKAKTIVLDTSRVLDGETVAGSAGSQCANCSRRVVCNKKITSYTCPDYIGLDDMCKPVPVVLTEEFAGSNKLKIYDILQSDYGYSYDEAVEKYNRSFLWRDKEIEEIKERLDRDQVVDVSAETESLDNLIAREHREGLEPEYNSDVVEEQFNTLRHIPATWLPTKLLEMQKISFNPKYFELMNQFVTHTLLRLASKRRCNITYRFKVTDESAESVLGFNEMLASLYLGTLRANNAILIRDDVKPPLVNWSNRQSNNLCALCENNCAIATIDSTGATNYEVAIPNKAFINRSFKFGKPVTQEALEKSVMFEMSEDDLATLDELGYPNKYLFEFNNTLYISEKVERTDETDQCATCSRKNYCSKQLTTLCDEYKSTARVLTSVEKAIGTDGTVNYAVMNDGDEIAVIPTYFKWHNKHLYAENATNDSIHAVEIRERQVYSLNDGSEAIFGSLYMFYDDALQDEGQVYKISSFVDIDEIIAKYTPIIRTITSQEDLGAYLYNMFDLIRSMQQYVLGSGDTLVHLAMREVLISLLYGGRINMDLVTTPKNSVTADGSIVATYSDWLASNKDSLLVFRSLDNMADSRTAWNEYTNVILDELLAQSNLPYTETSNDSIKYAKLKELVVRLSSYNINIIDTNNDATACVTFVPVTNNDTDRVVTLTHPVFVDIPCPEVKRPYAAHASITEAVNIDTDTPYQVSYFKGKWYERAGTLEEYYETLPASEADYDSITYDELRNVTSYTKKVLKTRVVWEDWTELVPQTEEQDANLKERVIGSYYEIETGHDEHFYAVAQENVGKNEIILFDNENKIIAEEDNNE